MSCHLNDKQITRGKSRGGGGGGEKGGWSLDYILSRLVSCQTKGNVGTHQLWQQSPAIYSTFSDI
jgi:hypothetical protein